MSHDFDQRNRPSFIPQSGMSDVAISDCNLLNSTARQSHRLQPLDDEEENVIIGKSPFEVVHEVSGAQIDQMGRIHMQSSLEAEENRDCVIVKSPGRHKSGNNSHGTSPYKDIGKGLNNMHCQISPVEPIKVAPPYRAPSGPR